MHVFSPRTQRNESAPVEDGRAEIPEDAPNQNPGTMDMCRKCHLLKWGTVRRFHSEKKTSEKKKALVQNLLATFPSYIHNDWGGCCA